MLQSLKLAFPLLPIVLGAETPFGVPPAWVLHRTYAAEGPTPLLAELFDIFPPVTVPPAAAVPKSEIVKWLVTYIL